MAAINKFVGKMYVDGIKQGWSEVFILKGTTVTTAKANMTAIINARKAMLSEDITIVYANVSDLGIKRDSYLALDGTADGSMTATTAKPNRDSDSFLIREETADGHVSNRYLRGVPDDCIKDTVYDGTGAAGVYETALAAYITALKTNTCHLNKVDPNDPTTWLLVDWENVFRRGITERKCGRFFDQHRGRRPVA